MRAAILGGGIAGLTAAHELARAGHTVTVYEAAPQAGGLASGFRDDPWEYPLERFYHHLFTTDRAIRDLVDEIGYGGKLAFYRQITAQWWNGRPHALQGGSDALGLQLGPLQARLPLPDIVATGLSVVAFPGMPLPHRMRMGAVSAYLKYLVRDWRPLERWTAADWTRRWMGERVYAAFVHPLLEGKFGRYAEQVNMAWLWARLKTRSFRLGYFEGGFQGFVDALVAHVRRAGVRVELDTPVVALTPLPAGEWRVAAVPNRGSREPVSEDFDAVVVTGSPELLARLLPQLPVGYLGQVKKLKSLGAVVMTIALRRPLTKNVYWMNLPKDEFPFLALVEHTNMISPRHYGGDHLVYCGDYLEPAHEYFQLSQEELLERFLPALKKVNPGFDRSWVRASWLHRETYAQPIVPVDHSRNVPPLSTPLPGVFWASMSQVYPWDRGTNFAVELGQRVAREVVRSPRP
ncbi:MAG: NAD(P)/FAD-dependent oxidoreductase [Sphingomonadaceae bacterium]